MWWYLTFSIIASAMVFTDARDRQMSNPVSWSVATLLLTIFVIPFYMAKRLLRKGEVREGGTAWNVLKFFALCWTLFMLGTSMVGVYANSHTINGAFTSEEISEIALGTTIDIAMMFVLWLFVIFGALVLGLFLRKPSVVDVGLSSATELVGIDRRQSTSKPKTAAEPRVYIIPE